MASTYSPLLRLELMANGEKSGQWGTITNTNLSTVLEQAIAGTTTIDITGQTSPITLTANDGSSDQSRAGILLITGTNASNMNIVAPAVSKVYVVNNTSDRSVTIKTSSSTGVTVATNTKQIIAYNTATTDFEAITQAPITSYVTSVQVSGGTTGLTYSGGPITSSGTITMAGTLALANGGTGASTQQGAINALLPGQGGQGGKFLTTDGTNVTWATVGGGGGGSVTSVDASGGTTGMTFSGGPITTSGTLTLSGTLDLDNGGTGSTTASGARTNLGLGNLATLNSVSLSSNVTGTLPVGNGGTGVTAYSSGQLLIGNASGTLSASTLTAGSGITITNGNGSITIASSSSGGGGITRIPRVSASGSSVVITGIPSGVKRVTILLDGISGTTNGQLYAGLGTISGGTTSGTYRGVVTTAGGTQSGWPSDKAMIVNSNGATDTWSGTVTFCNAIPSGGANVWTIVSSLARVDNAGGIRDAIGDVALDTSYVNRIFVSLASGTFDGGGITVFYES